MNEVDYLIVGGGLAGGNAALSIREKDNKGKILVVSEENYLPYDRVPLSKEFLLGTIDLENLYIITNKDLERKEITMLLGDRVVDFNLENRIAKLEKGGKIKFKKMLLATGGKVRRLKIEGSEPSGIYYLRTIDDSKAIKSEMENSENVVIIGGGFIGCELASVFSVKGLKVTVVEMLDNLLGAVLDKEMATWFTKYFSERGINLKLNSKVKRFLGSNRIEGVETDKGEIIKCDFAVVAIGIVPNDELAQKTGLKANNGIVVNEYLETEHQGIFSAGDVARFYSPIFNTFMRIEHYDVAVKQGKVAGLNMAGERNTFNEIPYFFSRMFNSKLIVKVYGILNDYDKIIQRGPDGKGSIIRFYLKDGIVNGIMLINASIRESIIKRLIKKKVDLEKLSSPSSRLEEL
jgi:NADPH-dependent 2,4-dienoyl-CoA reductase/sulfur reductase-like enzyme